MESKRNKPEQKQATIGDWDLLLIADEDGHLSVHISHKDGSQVHSTGADIDNDGEWGERFTTESIERTHASNQDKGEC